MAIPKLPWYNKLESVVAPTEDAANLALLFLIVVSILILIKGSPLIKVAWVVYLVSP